MALPIPEIGGRDSHCPLERQIVLAYAYAMRRVPAMFFNDTRVEFAPIREVGVAALSKRGPVLALPSIAVNQSLRKFSLEDSRQPGRNSGGDIAQSAINDPDVAR